MPFSPRAALARLNDPRSLAHGLVSSALTTGLTLIDPRRLGTGGRLAYRVAMAAVTAWTTWALLRTEDDGTLQPMGRAALTAGAAGTVLGVAEAGERLDARMHDGLVRAGARRPRLVLAAGAAALSLTGWLLDRRQASTELEGDAVEPEDEIVDLPAEARALAARLLAATDAFGAPELRAQLDEARATLYDSAEADGFWPGLGFDVPAHLPRAVPGSATFPVIGRFRALGGRTFDAYLMVEDGRLATLAVGEGGDWSDDEMEAWMEEDRGVEELEGWPAPSELELITETREGPRSIA